MKCRFAFWGLLLSILFGTVCAVNAQQNLVGRWILYDGGERASEWIEFLANGTFLSANNVASQETHRWRISGNTLEIDVYSERQVFWFTALSTITAISQTTFIRTIGDARFVYKRPQEMERLARIGHRSPREIGRLARENEREMHAERLAREERSLQGSSKLPRNASDGDIFRLDVSGTSIVLVFVAPGTFRMGAGASNTVGTDTRVIERQVTLTRGFWVGKFPVTQAQYQAVMGNNPSHFRNNPNNPVESVSWYNAVDFANRIGGRLPTSAEWEFAARGGNRSRGFIFSGSNTLSEVAWYNGNSNERTHPVGQLRGNELGIHDMSGNVNEWASDWDWIGCVDTAAVSDPTGPDTGNLRVLRGGGWRCIDFRDMSGLRIGRRSGNSPNDNRPFIRQVGFRIVFDAE